MTCQNQHHFTSYCSLEETKRRSLLKSLLKRVSSFDPYAPPTLVIIYCFYPDKSTFLREAVFAVLQVTFPKGTHSLLLRGQRWVGSSKASLSW